MTFAFLRSLVLVSFGAFVMGHALVRLAAHKAGAGETAPSLAIGLGTVAIGLALQAAGPAAAAVELAALALIVGALLALIRRHSRPLT